VPPDGIRPLSSSTRPSLSTGTGSRNRSRRSSSRHPSDPLQIVDWLNSPIHRPGVEVAPGQVIYAAEAIPGGSVDQWPTGGSKSGRCGHRCRRHRALHCQACPTATVRDLPASVATVAVPARLFDLGRGALARGTGAVGMSAIARNAPYHVSAAPQGRVARVPRASTRSWHEVEPGGAIPLAPTKTSSSQLRSSRPPLPDTCFGPSALATSDAGVIDAPRRRGPRGSGDHPGEGLCRPPRAQRPGSAARKARSRWRLASPNSAAGSARSGGRTLPRGRPATFIHSLIVWMPRPDVSTWARNGCISR